MNNSLTNMPDPDSPRSTAQQVEYWVRVVSLIVAIAVMGTWWISAAQVATASTIFMVLFATVGLGVTVRHLLILGIKRMVKSRIAQSKS